jgi:hypothetical protein
MFRSRYSLILIWPPCEHLREIAEVTKIFERNAIPRQIGRTDSVRTVGRRDSGRRAYREVFTACPERICPVELALLATGLVTNRKL